MEVCASWAISRATRMAMIWGLVEMVDAAEVESLWTAACFPSPCNQWWRHITELYNFIVLIDDIFKCYLDFYPKIYNDDSKFQC